MEEIDTNQNSGTWRKHWFVANVLVEIPIIGSFFKKKNLPDALHAAGKCAAALAGSTVAMMTILVPEDSDSMNEKMCKATASMAIGMTTAKVAYNCAYNGATMLHQYACRRNSAVLTPAEASTELQPMVLRL